MKSTFFLLLVFALSVNVVAQRKNETQKPFIGYWKFSTKSKSNDFQKVFNGSEAVAYKSEFFMFATDGTFKHDLLDTEVNLIRTFHGKWKSSSDKIKIKYAEFDYDLELNYFFIDKDLVLGQNFNHVIFTKEINFENPITMK